MRTGFWQRRGGWLLPVVLVSCSGSVAPTPAPTTPTADLPPLRSLNAPDYLVIGISGKCFREEQGLPFSCVNLVPTALDLTRQDTTNNYDYLTPRHTLSAIADVVAKHGTVRPIGFIASLPDRCNYSSGAYACYSGYLSMERSLQQFYKAYMTGVRNPTKLILVAHSHGTVWSHLFTRRNPEIPIEVQVDFDGVCLYWESDNKGDFAAAGVDPGIPPEQVCNGPKALIGGASTDLQNTVYPNVKYNVELQSSRSLLLNRLFDAVPNARLDGSARNIFSYRFEEEDHSGVTMPGSGGLTTAVSVLDKLLF